MEAEEEEVPTASNTPEKEEEPDSALQTKSNQASNARVSRGLSQKIKTSSGKGIPLPHGIRSEMESSFNTDFSEVNIHTDSEAINMNKELKAQAFTHGKDVYFNTGKYNVETTEGKRLLAHELTHVIQQNTDTLQKKGQKKIKSASNKESQKKAELIRKMIGGIVLNESLEKRVKSASGVFSLKQLERMSRAAVRFWPTGSSPSFLKRVQITSKAASSQRPRYYPQARVIMINNRSSTSDIRHEMAHAWDHVINIRSKKRLVPLESMKDKRLEREMTLSSRKPFWSQNDKKILAAFKRYRKRLMGNRKRASGEARRILAFDNPNTREGYSLTGVQEFYAEGFSVFHGGNEESKSRLKTNATELHIILTKEANKFK